MKIPHKFLLALCISLFISSCADRKPLLINPARPAISPSQVRVYAEKPKSPFETIALLEESHGGRNRSEKLLNEFREQAASVGANGVILSGVSNQGWRARPSGYASSIISNRGSGFGLGLGLNVNSPRIYGKAQAIYLEEE